MPLIPKFDGGVLGLDPSTVISIKPAPGGGSHVLIQGTGWVWLAAMPSDAKALLFGTDPFSNT